MPQHTWLPVDLCELAITEGMAKPLAVYLYLKISVSGKCHYQSEVFGGLCTALSIKDKRTLRKHLDALLKKNWIGFNPATGYYFIRKYGDLLGIKKPTKRLACKATMKDLTNIMAFLSGILICDNIRRQKYLEHRRRNGRAASKNKVNANQPGYFSYFPGYFGISNRAIARMLGCQQTRACQLKQQAEKAGYIKTKERCKEILELEKNDYCLRHQLYEQNPGLTGRLLFKKMIKGKKAVLCLVQQTYDEVIPRISFSVAQLKSSNSKKPN